MAKATAIKLGELNSYLLAEECVSAKKKNFRRGRVVPDFPVDGHIYIYLYTCIYYIYYSTYYMSQSMIWQNIS